MLSVLGCFIGTSALAARPSANPTSDATRPNIVVVMADDMGYRDASCYGCVDFQTPHIDALARDGIRMTAGYVSHPYCSPSRAGLVAGDYQQSFGHEHNPPYRENDTKIGIDASTRLLPDLLREQRYATGLVGKWHLGAGAPFRPNVRGFTDFFGFLGGGHHYFKAVPAGNEYNGLLWRNGERTEESITYLTDDLTREAQAFIAANHTRPFCLLVMYNAPHAPDQVTEQYLERVRDIPHPGRRRYAALVSGVDEGLGKIRQTLAQYNLDTNTIVFFLSDNGGRSAVSDNRPLRGGKGWLHEGGIRVPFIAAWPGQWPAGKTYEHPVSALDILPTALAAAHIDLPPGIAGVDLAPFLTGRNHATPHQTLHWRVCGGKGYAIRHGDWKLVHDVGMQRPMLYNLADDIGEDHDLSDTEPQRLAQLTSLYQTWSASLETPRWTEGHEQNTTRERARAREAGTRQFPMPWVTREQ